MFKLSQDIHHLDSILWSSFSFLRQSCFAMFNLTSTSHVPRQAFGMRTRASCQITWLWKAPRLMPTWQLCRASWKPTPAVLVWQMQERVRVKVVQKDPRIPMDSQIWKIGFWSFLVSLVKPVANLVVKQVAACRIRTFDIGLLASRLWSYPSTFPSPLHVFFCNSLVVFASLLFVGCCCLLFFVVAFVEVHTLLRISKIHPLAIFLCFGRVWPCFWFWVRPSCSFLVVLAEVWRKFGSLVTFGISMSCDLWLFLRGLVKWISCDFATYWTLQHLPPRFVNKVQQQ